MLAKKTCAEKCAISGGCADAKDVLFVSASAGVCEKKTELSGNRTERSAR